jgi:hypothetical protein
LHFLVSPLPLPEPTNVEVGRICAILVWILLIPVYQDVVMAGQRGRVFFFLSSSASFFCSGRTCVANPFVATRHGVTEELCIDYVGMAFVAAVFVRAAQVKALDFDRSTVSKLPRLSVV